MRYIFASLFLLVSVQAVTNETKIYSKGESRYIKTNSWPISRGQFPNRNNPNTIKEIKKTYQVPLSPTESSSKNTVELHTAFGVALNGILFDPMAAEFWQGDRSWQYEAMSSYVSLGLDKNKAHVQPNGTYHYHGMPVGLIKRLKAKQKKRDMLLIGYAADGFPIYAPWGYKDPMNRKSKMIKMKPSYTLKKGQRSTGPGGKYDGRFIKDYSYKKGLGTLDKMNGRFGVTPEYPKGIYHYFITYKFPFIPRYFKGTPDQTFRKGPGGAGGRRSDRGGRRGGPGEGRRPPRGEGPPPPHPWEM